MTMLIMDTGDTGIAATATTDGVPSVWAPVGRVAVANRACMAARIIGTGRPSVQSPDRDEDGLASCTFVADCGPIHLDKVVLFQRGDDRSQLAAEQRDEICDTDIARSHEQEFRGSAVQHVRVVEVGVFCHDDATILIRTRSDLLISRQVLTLTWQLGRMHRIMAGAVQETAETWRQVGVNQELHVSARC